MESEHPISSRLKQAREAKNLSIAELSKITNIRMHILQALDEGRVEELPKVYMRSFIKRYAQSVGISSRDIEELMNRYLAVETPQSSVRNIISASTSSKTRSNSAVVVGRSRQRTRWLGIFYTLLGLAVVGGLYYMYAPSKVVAPKSNAPAPSVVVSDKDSSSNVPATSGGLLTYFGASSADSVSLEATTTDTVWINITMDGKASEQVTMQPHQTKKWVALERFLLSIGNAGGVKLKRNGVDLPQVGKLGETVRSIRITKTEFVTSASPWKSQRDSLLSKPKPLTKPVPVKPGVTKPGTQSSLPQNKLQPAAAKNTIPSSKPSPASLGGKTAVVKPGAQTPPTVPHTMQAKPSTGSIKPSPAATTTTKNSATATSKPAVSTTTTLKPPASKTLSAAETKRIAAQKKAILNEQIARKKRLERIRREASRKEITPVQIKP